MAELHVNLGQAFEQRGNTDAAVACYEKAVALDPRGVQAHRSLVDLTTFTIDDQDKIGRLESLLNDKRLSENDTEHVHWALGKVYDDCGVFDKAFKHYEIANDCERQRKQIAFNATAYTEAVSRLIAVYTREFFAERQQFGSDSTLPVFVIGLPRAGKSLTESLIATHADIHGAGEIEFFRRLTRELSHRLKTADPYPACVSSIDSQTVNTLAEAYIEELRKHSSEAARIVHAIPNFLNLGLVTLLFPKARIIHCRRDPLDVCTSIYFKSFAGVVHPYAYKLTDIAHYYREYERLMDHWLRVVPDRILTLDYEDMVSNEDATRRRLIQWCGLANDTKESDAGRDDGLLSTRYIGRWKNYDEFIEPLKRELGK
jgi:tetratricopeptide (TPR) repeat protein